MYPRVLRTSGALALLAAFPVSATETIDPDAIVVTATRFSETDPGVAANVSVITRHDVDTSGAQTLPSVLGTRAGVNVSDFGGSMGKNASIDLRGFGATATSNTLILLDGQRVTPVDMGSIIWSAMPLGNIKRIEIIRGSGAVLYGDGASGGVVNIITNKSGNPVASLTGTLGSFGYRGTDIQLADSNDTTYYNLAFNYADTDGYRTNSQQDQQTASGRVGRWLDRGEVFTDFSVYRESGGLPSSLKSVAYSNDRRSSVSPFSNDARDGYRLRPGVAYRLTDTLTLEGEIGIEHQNLAWNAVSSYSSSTNNRVRDTTSFTPRLRWSNQLWSLSNQTVAGFDFYDGKIAADASNGPDQNARQKSQSLYVQNTTKITPDLSLTLGDRWERMYESVHQDAYVPDGYTAVDGDATATRNTYDLGLAYAREGWRVYGKHGTTFRFANLDELFFYDPATYQPLFSGNLRPQHGSTNEIGGSMALGAVKLRASVYQMDITDEIGYDGSNNVNLDPTRRRGSELEADWTVSSSLQARASYSYTEAIFRSGAYAGNTVPQVPRHQASVQISWDGGRVGRYSATARRIGEQRYGSDLANTQGMVAEHTTLDLQSTWNFKPWTLTARVLNATDKKYAAFAGYSTYSGAKYYYPADGRSILVSARYDFR